MLAFRSQGLPAPIVPCRNAETRNATPAAGMRERLLSEGFDLADGPPEGVQGALKRAVQKRHDVVQRAKVGVQS